MRRWMTFWRTGTRKSKSNYKESGKPIQRTHWRGFDRLAVFFVCCRHSRVTVFFCRPAHSHENRLWKSNPLLVGQLPTQKGKTAKHRGFSRKGCGGVVSTKRGLLYCEQNRGISLRFSAFWNCGKSVHETNCFIEHPPQAPWHTP